MTSVTMDHLPLAHLQAPQRDGEVLLWPQPQEWPALAEANRLALQQSQVSVGERLLSELSLEARRELLAAAQRWTGRYRTVVLPEQDGSGQIPPIYVTGHQPELFHPGVWLKNMVLSAAASQAGAIAVHLIVDGDILKSGGVPVPTGSPDHARVNIIPFDGGPGGVPFEDRPIADRKSFREFGQRVLDSLRPLVSEPLIQDFWPTVDQAAEMTQSLGHTLSVARHLWEAQWGWKTLEIPQSWVCQLPSFLVFAASLWLEAERFLEIHNRAVDEYRKRHKLRSRSHPFPHLAKSDGWCEVPFWTWTRAAPLRQKLFVRRNGPCLELSDLENWQSCLPISRLLDRDWLVDWARQLEESGRRIRSRAVITTLFARVCLGDFFIHGLGGAKYDQVTDAILREFLGLTPPAYATVTGTVLLPVERPSVDAEDLRRVRWQLRDLEFHPDRHICLNGLPAEQQEQVRRLIEEKQSWIERPVTPENAALRYRRIRAINQALQPFVSQERARLQVLLQATGEKLRLRKILGSRDWAFCLYPEKQLKAFYQSVQKRHFGQDWAGPSRGTLT